MVELLPCPFCGCKAKLTDYNTGLHTSYFATCANVHCAVYPFAGNSYQSKDEAIEAWNTRAHEIRINVTTKLY